MRLRRIPHHRERGVAVVEFLFAVPAFLILVFFVVELALMWTDRHVMRVAAYRAVRTLIKIRTEQGQTAAAQLCWDETATDGGTEENKAAMQRPRRAATKVMSMVTPTIGQMLGGFGQSNSSALESGLTQPFQAGFAALMSNAEDQDFIRPLMRLIKGIPSAWYLTKLSCKSMPYGMNNAPGVEITLTYYRSAKMPFVGQLLWILYFLNAKVKGDDAHAFFAPIDPLTYGLDLKKDNPEFMAYLKARTEKALHDLTDALIQRAQDKVKSALEKIPSSAGIPIYDPAILAEEMGKTATQLANPAQDILLEQGAQVLNFTADAIGQLLLAIPGAFRFIPVSVSVRMPVLAHAVWNDHDDWTSKVSLIGTYGIGNSNSEVMSRNLGQVVDKMIKDKE